MNLTEAISPERATQPQLHHSPPSAQDVEQIDVPRLESLPTFKQEYYPVSLEIGAEHIARMEYFFNEAPMCDYTTQNAVALAIGEVVKAEFRVSVSLSNGEAVAQVGDATCLLGDPIGRWLKAALRGGVVEPFRQTIWLPVNSLLSSTPLLSVFSPPDFPSE